MITITPDHLERLPKANATMTVNVGGIFETVALISVPENAETILTAKEGIRYHSVKDSGARVAVEGMTDEQLDLMADAFKTMDLICHDRTEPLRTDLLLALTYGLEFDPMITGPDRYAYEELDWGYTEQPYRQLSCCTPLQGRWDLKQQYLTELLKGIQGIARPDAVLDAALRSAIELMGGVDEDGYETMRNAFDLAAGEQDYLYENLLVYMLHRHWYDDVAQGTVASCVKRMMAAFAVLRSICAVAQQGGHPVTPSVFADLASRYAAAVDEGADLQLRALMAESPVFRRENLQRMLWR